MVSSFYFLLWIGFRAFYGGLDFHATEISQLVNVEVNNSLICIIEYHYSLTEREKRKKTVPLIVEFFNSWIFIFARIKMFSMLHTVFWWIRNILRGIQFCTVEFENCLYQEFILFSDFDVFWLHCFFLWW